MTHNPQRGRDRSHATWVWRVILALVLLAICAVIGPLLLGCTTGEPTPTNAPRPPTTARTAAQTAPRQPSRGTIELCDALVFNYMHDRLPREDTRALLFEQARQPGIDGRVRDLVLNHLYASGSPTGKPYDAVVEACRNAGVWAS